METQGTISIRAFTSLAQIPIQGATAAVTRPTGLSDTAMAMLSR